VRFMDLQAINNSKLAHWADRPRPSHATYSGRGVAPEALVDLANTLHADAWFCVPHLADDDYVRQLAALVSARLDPARRVYIENSTELWNPLFEQSRPAGPDFGARRSQRIFELWQQAFPRRERLVRVLSSQAANPRTAETVLRQGGADALAIAPYI